MRVFGIDPGSERTGYGCVETGGSRHSLVTCGAIRTSASATFPEKLLQIFEELTVLLVDCQPDAVAVENLFFATNARSALKLGHARGVAVLAAVRAGLSVAEYSPAEIKRAVVGYGRAEKPQVQHMVKLLLGLAEAPSPHDAADALAVAICHVHAGSCLARPSTRGARPGDRGVRLQADGAAPAGSKATSWRTFRPAPARDALRRGKPARP